MLLAKADDSRIKIIALCQGSLSFELRNQGANTAAYVDYLPFRKAFSIGQEIFLDELTLSLGPASHQLAVGRTKAMFSVSAAIVNGELA
jgi:hypothetical protein